MSAVVVRDGLGGDSFGGPFSAVVLRTNFGGPLGGFNPGILRDRDAGLEGVGAGSSTESAGTFGSDNREDSDSDGWGGGGDDWGDVWGFALRIFSGAVWGSKTDAGDDERLESICMLRGPAGLAVWVCMSSIICWIPFSVCRRRRRCQRAARTGLQCT